MSWDDGHWLRYVGLVDRQGTVVAPAKIYRTFLCFHGEVLETIGLGAVFTQETFRRQGYAQRLLTEILGRAPGLGFKAEFLWSGIGAKYYQKCGFVPYSLEKFSLPTVATENSFHTQETKSEDKTFMQDLFHKSTVKLEISTYRNRMTWDLFRYLNPTRDFIVRSGAGPIGYFSGSKGNDYFWLEEAIALSGRQADLEKAILHYAAGLSLTHIRGWNQPFGIYSDVVKSPIPDPLPMIRVWNGALSVEKTGKFFFGSLDYF